VNSQVTMKVSELFIVVHGCTEVSVIYICGLSHYTDLLFYIQAAVITFLAKPWLPNVLVTFHRAMTWCYYASASGFIL